MNFQVGADFPLSQMPMDFTIPMSSGIRFCGLRPDILIPGDSGLVLRIVVGMDDLRLAVTGQTHV